MAKRYPADSREDLAAKRQTVDQATAGEDSLVFEGDPSLFLVKLYKTIITGGFSDVTLKFKYGETMKGHRVILSAMSPLMKTELERQSESIVDLSSITKDAFVKLLDYTFHGRLQLEEIGKKSEEKLKQRLTLDTCLRIFHLANRINCKNLVEATGRFVVENLRAVSQTADWWTQAEEGITDVCLAAKRQGANPETLAEAILEWLELNKKDPDVVTRMITNVLPLKDLSVDDITTKVMPHPALRGNTEAIKITTSAIQAKLSSSPKLRSSPKLPSTPKLPSSPIVAPPPSSTTPSSSKVSLSGACIGPGSSSASPGGQPGKKLKSLLVAGWRRNESVLYQWQSGSASWDKIPIPRHGLGAAMLYFKGQVIVTGGRVQKVTLREAEKEGEQNRTVNYPPHTMTSLVKLQTRDSTDGPPMLRARSDHGMVKIGNSIYVAGDSIDVEEYNKDRWTVVGKLHSKMKKCGVGASGEIILVVGGCERGNEKMIQAFNTRTCANATLVGLLPMAMPEVRCAGTNQGKLVFLSKEGKMLQIAGESDNYAISPTTDLRKMTTDFDATIRGQHIVVCTGHLKDEVRVDSKGSVFLKYKLQDGKEVNCEIPSLPELLRVYGLTTTGIAP